MKDTAGFAITQLLLLRDGEIRKGWSASAAVQLFTSGYIPVLIFSAMVQFLQPSLVRHIRWRDKS
ncbi:MAG TPA: hypothetical protein VF433_01570 [Cellvibrio sp.]